MIGALKKREPGLKGFDDTMAFRQKTSGEMGRAIAAIMNTAHNIPAEKAEKIERAFENVSMAGQVYDDLQDLSQDRNEHVKENIIYQILRKNPEELAKVGDSLKISPKIGFRRLKRLAPNTAQEAADLQKKYLDNIGPEKEFSHLRGFAGLIELR
jgi:geranylgeranyl pyrophosphate synthase